VSPIVAHSTLGDFIYLHLESKGNGKPRSGPSALAAGGQRAKAAWARLVRKVYEY
jgi:hypothetical protein